MSKTKYRIRRRAKGWAVQRQTPILKHWLTLTEWRWHWAAAFHLAFMREWYADAYPGRTL